MLNGDNYENSKKSIGPMNQKTVLHVQHTFLNISTYTFYVHFMLKNVVEFPFAFFIIFFPSFIPWWPLAFVVFSPPL